MKLILLVFTALLCCQAHLAAAADKPSVIIVMTGNQPDATGMVGKWHLGDNAPHRPQDHGFEDVVWHRCGGVGQASDYWGNDYFDDTDECNGKAGRAYFTEVEKLK